MSADQENTDSHDTAEGLVFMGCIGQAGHYYWTDERTRTFVNPSPWPKVDGAFTRRDDTRQGVANLHCSEGWTALAIHDYTVDARSGSNATFLCPGTHTKREMEAMAVAKFPSVAARLGIPDRQEASA